MYFQDLILTLQRYWNDRGCLFIQPYDMEKGAATFNPATWLRALGPEPFFAAFAEPCRRPTDGRYGDNPIRMQHYYQYQVVLKPSPPDIVDLYLGSLEAIGILPSEHDIRFVHDDWESPTLGAWGLGWEVWLDGMEVTQFTYFQQVGGIELRPVTGEITYGLERLCMFLQGVDTVYDLQYNAAYTYGDVFHRTEVLNSTHNFEQADVELMFDLFTKYETESGRLAELGNPVAAADYCLKASHAFNMLDARGAISVNERQNYILRVRDIARRTAEAWLADREALGFPWQNKKMPGIEPAFAASTHMPTAPGGEREPLLLELGVEEMPAAVFEPLYAQIPALVEKHFGSLDLEPQDVQFFATPRRLVLSIGSLRTATPDRDLEVKGPPLRVARDADGNWTKAGTSFAERNGMTPEDLTVREDGGQEYLYALSHQKGESALPALSKAIPAFFADIHWYKTMRWGDGDTNFVRPVQWLVALLGDTVVSTSFAGIPASAQSRGHRFLSNYSVDVTADREAYLDALRDRSVIVNQDERRELIRHAITERAEELGLRWRVDEELLAEVTNLVEFPVPVIGEFDVDYLQIPDAVLVSEMKAHQRYLAIENTDGTLSNRFIAISNSVCMDMRLVCAGYENVLRSRFADARFFLAEDMKRTLDDRVQDLEQALYQQGLGTILDKVGRIRKLAAHIGATLGYDAARLETIDRIATLCKADLTTAMVYEFPELQGEIGRYYAMKEGLPAGVAEGIREHYLPKGAQDRFPASDEAAVVGLADRLDTLAGIFAIGKAPKSGDPFGLRRACLTSMAIIMNRDLSLDFAALLDAAMDTLDVDRIIADAVANTKKPKLTSRAELREQLLDFALTRLQGLLEAEARDGLPGGFKRDSIAATIQASTAWHDVADLARRVDAMDRFRVRDDFADLAATFKRVNNICDRAHGDAVDPALFAHPKEAELLAAVDAANTQVSAALETQDYVGALAAIVPLRTSVDGFMDDGPMVNDPDEAIKANRHRLLRRILDLVLRIADFSAIAG